MVEEKKAGSQDKPGRQGVTLQPGSQDAAEQILLVTPDGTAVAGMPPPLVAPLHQEEQPLQQVRRLALQLGWPSGSRAPA